MAEEKTLTEIGIKYNVVKVTDTLYILVPIDKIEGYSFEDKFYSTTIEPMAYSIDSLQRSTLIDSVASLEKLKAEYDCDDLEFIADYHFEVEKDYLLTIEIKDGKLIKRKVNYSEFVKSDVREIYERQKDMPTVTLNCDALDQLMNSGHIDEVREKLERYRRLIRTFRDKEKKEGVTIITVNNGHVSEIGMNKKVAEPQTKTASSVITGAKKIDINAVSVVGLERYLKERVFGHDDELRYIATKLIMNYRATPEDGTESILIVGPTGTGKTETVKAGSEYLDLPFIPVNSANLVPQGIKGPSLEDYLYALLVQCGYDLERAQRGFIFLDEFDKIGKDSLDIKETVKQIFLKFIEGDTFMIDKPSGDYNFNTRMLNKVFAGAFQELYEKKSNPVGFGAERSEEFVFTPSKITQGNYFGKELVTRIPNVFAYSPLTKEEQKKVMLESKLSILLAKKRRYEREFGAQVIIQDDYVDAVLEKLKKEDKSMRDLNNLILETLQEAEYQLLANEGKVKQLILTPEIITDPKQIIIK